MSGRWLPPSPLSSPLNGSRPRESSIILDNTFCCRPQRAAASGRSLSAEDVSIVKGMLARGDRQHDIAAHFGVNGGRIAEIATGQKFSDVPVADPAKLPEPGIFVSLLDRAALAGAINRLGQVRDELSALLLQLQSVLPGKRP